MSYKPLLPPPLIKAAHIKAFDAIIRNYLGSDTDLGAVNGLTGEAIWYYVSVLDFDTVPAVILPYLSIMFGVDGIKGWNWATTEALQRQCLKNAILKKRRHGTPWSITTALTDAGFQFVVINERPGNIYFANGANQFNGGIQADSYNWAMFTLEMQPPVGMTAQQVDLVALMQLVNYWKRKCTLCISLTINQLVITNFGIGGPAYLADGVYIADGTTQFTG